MSHVPFLGLVYLINGHTQYLLTAFIQFPSPNIPALVNHKFELFFGVFACMFSSACDLTDFLSYLLEASSSQTYLCSHSSGTVSGRNSALVFGRSQSRVQEFSKIEQQPKQQSLIIRLFISKLNLLPSF